MFASRRLIGPAVLVTGDLLLALGVGLWFIGSTGRGLVIPKGMRSLGVFFAAAGLSALMSMSNSLSSPVESILFFAKMSLYWFGLLCMWNYIRDFGSTEFIRILRILLSINLAMSLAQQTAHRLGMTSPVLRAYQAGRWDRSSFPRTQALFSEPSTLAIFVVVVLSYFYLHRQLRRSDLAIGAVLLALAASLSGIALALLMCGVFSVKRGVIKPRMIGAAVAGVMVFALAVLTIPAVGQVFEDRVAQRLVETTGGGAQQDASSSGRLVGSWQAGIRLAEDNIVTGVGPGNYAIRLADIQRQGELTLLDPRILSSGGSWNIFANTLAEFGLLGLTTLLSILWAWLRRSPPSLILAIAIGFASGTLVGWLWWFSCGLLKEATEASRQRDSYEGQSLNRTAHV